MINPKSLFLWSIFCLMLIFIPTAVSQQNQTELLVAAAANLTDVFSAIAEEFQEQTGIKVTMSFGATGSLARQVENGAPFDLFASADVTTVQRLVEQGLILADSASVYARGRLIAWWVDDGALELETLNDLLKPQVERIAMATPALAPYGQAAQETLMSLGIWDQVQPKVVYAESVLAAKQIVATGNAEVAFIALSLVQPGKDRFLIVPEKLHRPLDQALGILKSTPHLADARRFSDFVLNGRGRELLQEYFYIIPAPGSGG